MNEKAKKMNSLETVKTIYCRLSENAVTHRDECSPKPKDDVG